MTFSLENSATQRWDLLRERELYARLCQRSLWAFILHAYGAKYNPRVATWLDEQVQRPMVEWFQHHALEWLGWRKDGIVQQKSLMLIVPREFAKTTLITQAGQLWLHIHDPNLSTYTGNETVTGAQEFLASIMSVIDGTDPYAKFTALYGNWFHPDRKFSASMVVHAARTNTSRKEPSFGTWGVEKSLTRTHPDAGFLDDPTSYEAMENDTAWLQKVNDHWDALIPVFTADSLLVLPGTRYGEGDHFGRLIAEDGIATISGVTDDPEYQPREGGRWHVFFLQARDKLKHPVYTRKWPEWRLADFERKNPQRYASQMMNKPSESTTNQLTMDKLKTMLVRASDVPWDLQFSIHCDTGFKTRPGGQATGRSKSVMELWGHHMKTGVCYFIEGYGEVAWGAEAFMSELLTLLTRLHRGQTCHSEIVGRWPFVITDEEDLGQHKGSWELALESWCRTSRLPVPNFLILKRPPLKKLVRISAVVPHWVNDRVRLVESAPGVDHLMREMSKLGYIDEYDFADAAADVFHPEVYSPPPPRGALTGTGRDIRLPWDEILKGTTDREEFPYEPI